MPHRGRGPGGWHIDRLPPICVPYFISIGPYLNGFGPFADFQRKFLAAILMPRFEHAVPEFSFTFPLFSTSEKKRMSGRTIGYTGHRYFHTDRLPTTFSLLVLLRP